MRKLRTRFFNQNILFLNRCLHRDWVRMSTRNMNWNWKKLIINLIKLHKNIRYLKTLILTWKSKNFNSVLINCLKRKSIDYNWNIKGKIKKWKKRANSKMNQTIKIFYQQLINLSTQMFSLQTIATILKAFKINQKRKFLSMRICRAATSHWMKLIIYIKIKIILIWNKPVKIYWQILKINQRDNIIS